MVEKQIRGVIEWVEKRLIVFIDFEHYNQFLRFIDLLLHISPQWLLDIYWSCFYSYFIDHTTRKTTWEDPRLKRPEAIPLTQFKVKVTMI